MHLAAASLVVLLAALGGCGSDASGTSAPVAPMPASPRPSKSAPPAVAMPAPSDPTTHAASEPPPEPALRDRPSNCTLVDCLDGFDVEVFPKLGWRAGQYRFVIKHDRETTICEGRLPLEPCSRLPGITCSRRTVSMAASGCALPPSHHSFDEIVFHSHPATVDIDVFRNGVRLTRAHYVIEYAEQRPNGEHCGPICRSATRPGYLTLPAEP